MAPGDKPLVWLHGEIKTPPFSPEARLEAGVLLRKLQQGEKAGPAALPTDAGDRAPVSRATGSGCDRNLADRLPPRSGRCPDCRGVCEEDGDHAPPRDSSVPTTVSGL